MWITIGYILSKATKAARYWKLCLAFRHSSCSRMENLKIADYVYVVDLGHNKFDGPVEEITDLKNTFWA